MKRALILCLFVAINVNAGQCATNYFPPLQPVAAGGFLTDNNLASLQVPNPMVSYPKINEIESSLYGRIFTAQDILLRLSRIEKSIFSTTYPNSSLAQRVDNIVMNFNQINQYPNISKASLSRIESKVFGRNYAQNDAPTRIERLEQELLGAVQQGDMTTRYETLKVAASNYNVAQSSDSCQNPIPAGKTGWKSLLSSLGSAFFGGGTLTGFSPQIDPFSTSSAYNPSGYNNFANLGGGCNSPGYGMYNGTRTNHGFSDQYKSYGTGSRVTILD